MNKYTVEEIKELAKEKYGLDEFVDFLNSKKDTKKLMNDLTEIEDYTYGEINEIYSLEDFKSLLKAYKDKIKKIEKCIKLYEKYKIKDLREEEVVCSEGLYLEVYGKEDF